MYFIAVKKTRPLSVREGGKGVSSVILTKCDSKGVLFLSKLVYKRVRGWTSGKSPPPAPATICQSLQYIEENTKNSTLRIHANDENYVYSCIVA